MNARDIFRSNIEFIGSFYPYMERMNEADAGIPESTQQNLYRPSLI